MPLTLAVPEEYGYVLATATLTTVVAWYHNFHIGPYRRAAKISHPNHYASAAEAKESKEKYLYNCAQRAHGNFLEHQPQMLVGLLVGGLKYPVVSSCVGTAWCASRILYAWGYTRKDKEDGKGRSVGLGFFPLEFALTVMAGMASYQMIMA